MTKAVVIGCGRMGDRHVQSLVGLAIEVVGLYDVNEENAKAVASKNNLDPMVVKESVSSIFAMKDIDLCVIATTAPSHKELCISAMNAGIKKILCEKPLARSILECQQIAEAAEQYGAHVAVNHQMRYLPQYTIPKALLTSEKFGGISSINATTGNFGMAMNGLHYIEMMRFMLDEMPTKVTAWFDEVDLPNPRGAEFKDRSGCIRIESAHGKRFYLDASADNGHGLIMVYVAKHGQIAVDELAGQIYASYRKPEERELPTTRYGQPHLIDSQKIPAIDVVSSTQEVVKALLNGSGYPSIQDATYAIKVLAAAYVSNENNNESVEITDPRIDEMRVFPWA